MAYIVENEAANRPKAQQPLNNPSNWGNLSDLYLARLQTCERDGTPKGDVQVVALATEGDLALASQFSTPFENSNPENKLPTMMGMLQDGSWVETAAAGMSGLFGIDLGEDTKESMNTLQGRSNFTKVNSTQIFLSSNSVSVPMTLLFSAWEDAATEVEQQVALIQEWTLPEELADGSILAEVLENRSLLAAFPSLIPPYVALTYGGKTYAPFFIQESSAPIVAPMDDNGNRVALKMNITLISRTAWDKNNILSLYGK